MRSCRGFILVYVLVAGFFMSCRPGAREKKFFDIPGYFRTETEALGKSNLMVTKTVSYKNDTSKNELKASAVNWQKELAIFLEADINKPVYYSYMQQQVITNDTHGQRLRYYTTSSKINIRQAEIDQLENGETIAVSLHIERSDLISSTSIDAFYAKGDRYVVSGEQKIHVLGDKTTFFSEGYFHK